MLFILISRANRKLILVLRAPAYISSAALALTRSLQKWARQVQVLIEGGGKGAMFGVQGLNVGIGGAYNVRDSGVIEVDWNDV